MLGEWLKWKSPAAKLKNLLANHYRNLDAATPIRFTRSSCKDNSISHAAAAPSNLDAANYSPICRDRVAKHNRIARTSAKTRPELAVTLRGRSENDPKRTCSPTARRTSFPIHLPGHFFCPAIKTQNFVHLLTFRNPFRARLPLKSENGRCENKAFLRDFPPKVKMKERCENEAFVRDFPQRVKGEDAKARLSCETSLKKWTWASDC